MIVSNNQNRVLGTFFLIFLFKVVQINHRVLILFGEAQQQRVTESRTKEQVLFAAHANLEQIQYCCYETPIEKHKNYNQKLTQLVNTLAAALLKWKLRMLRIESAHMVITYSSPPLSDMTSFSASMNIICAASRQMVTPSWGPVAIDM